MSRPTGQWAVMLFGQKGNCKGKGLALHWLTDSVIYPRVGSVAYEKRARYYIYSVLLLAFINTLTKRKCST